MSLPATWPKQVSGTLYRNGPALHQFAGQRYHRWFDGDGMVHRFHIANGTLHYHARFVETAKLTAERAAGKRLRASFGTYYPGPATPMTSIAPISRCCGITKNCSRCGRPAGHMKLIREPQ